MTAIEVAPDLVEEAVFLALRGAADRGDPRAVARLERRERLYAIADRSARDRAFRELALAAFRDLHLSDPLRLALEGCPSAAARLDALFVRRARRAKEEGAELYCAGGRDGARGTRAVLALRPERFLDLEALYELVRREMLFVDDMLDEGFGYAPDALDRLDLDPGRRDVARERVTRAWRQRVDARARGDAARGTFPDLVAAAVSSLRPG